VLAGHELGEAGHDDAALFVSLRASLMMRCDFGFPTGLPQGVAQGAESAFSKLVRVG
jgi:hypothetical protein